MRDLFSASEPRRELEPGAVVLDGFALGQSTDILEGVAAVAVQAPFRQMTTPGGRRMSVAMTNCGAAGWVTDAGGYRYAAADPVTGRSWPELPEAWMSLAARAADAAGFLHFVPDGCLVNRYEPGSRMALHQDLDEHDHGHPIVSVSLGVPARFLWGGARRADPPRRITLQHGDVVVWGGPARLRFHGVLPLAAGWHAATGPLRYNLTFRRAR